MRKTHLDVYSCTTCLEVKGRESTDIIQDKTSEIEDDNHQISVQDIVKQLIDTVCVLESECNKQKSKIDELEQTTSTQQIKVNSLEQEIKLLQKAMSMEVTAIPPPEVKHSFSRNVITMKQGDILKIAKNSSMAHCVGKDMLMSDGLAKTIKSTFNINVESLQICLPKL